MALMNDSTLQISRQVFGIDGWGNGYFGINAAGNVCVHPFGDERVSLDLGELMSTATRRRIQTPILFRFPQILETQLNRLHKAFQTAMDETKYDGQLRCVFPFKVNQRKEFIDEIVRCGHKHAYGLEVGTKTELFAAMHYELHPEALLICNGFKDSHLIELAFDAKKMGKNIVLVIEGTDELKYIIEYAKTMGFCVDIGLRAKLYAKGSGLWEKSGGAESKFGLSTVEMTEALFLIEEAGLKEHLVMVHYHIGSQITEIKRVKNAMKEASRVYAKICKSGFNLKILNIGGGIGVDYDGSKTSFYVSANYNLREFANDVVYIIQEVCNSEGVKCPTIVSESGRYVAAFHSLLITDVREVEKMGGDISEVVLGDSSHKLLGDLLNVCKQINGKNYVEYYHDALEYRDELFTLFNLGFLELEDRARSEVIFNEICSKALYYHAVAGVHLEEFEDLAKSRTGKYLANFSIFQSIPDFWGIQQLFPVMPITRLNEKTTRTGVIMDITCDSDGCLGKFVDKHDVKQALELHVPQSNAPYYVGFFLVGAYQEALGNNHNLYGAVNELNVRVLPNGSIESIDDVRGEDVGELLRMFNYRDEDILSGYVRQLRKRLDSQAITSAEYDRMLARVKVFLTEYPYLVSKSRLEIIG
jgi:arginine decarboxylase